MILEYNKKNSCELFLFFLFLFFCKRQEQDKTEQEQDKTEQEQDKTEQEQEMDLQKCRIHFM